MRYEMTTGYDSLPSKRIGQAAFEWRSISNTSPHPVSHESSMSAPQHLLMARPSVGLGKTAVR